jgi:hypothetical protein
MDCGPPVANDIGRIGHLPKCRSFDYSAEFIYHALRTLVDLHVLTKPSGTRGHYAFDDPMFREWFSKAMSL